MNKALRILLIMIACACFGVAISYPIKLYTENKQNQGTMDQLAALRDAGLQRAASAAAEGGTRERLTQAPAIEEPATEAPVTQSPTEQSIVAQVPATATPTMRPMAQAWAQAGTTQLPRAQADDQDWSILDTISQQTAARTEGLQAAAAQSQPTQASVTQTAGAQPTAPSWSLTGQGNVQPASAQQTAVVELTEIPATQAPATERPTTASWSLQGQGGTETTPTRQPEAAERTDTPAPQAPTEQPTTAPQQALITDAPAAEQPTAQAWSLQTENTQAPTEALAVSDDPTPTPTNRPTAGIQEAAQTAHIYPELQKATPVVTDTPTPSPSPSPSPTPSPSPSPTPDRRVSTGVKSWAQLEKVSLDEEKILPQYEDLYAINKEMVGWMTIPGTYVDYPVMQREGDEDYYLTHDFFGQDNENGLLILDMNCDQYTPSYNLVVSGHNRWNNQMFSNISDYQKKWYWEQHKLIYFDSLMEERTYVVFAAFFAANYDENEKGFRYNCDIKYDIDAEQWLEQVRDYQMYDTGIDAEFGDEFLTLTTCNNTKRKNGRFVVVARRVREGESFE